MNINKYTLDYFFLCGAGFCLLLATAANAAPPTKIDVCHAPPDNPENIQLIQVGAKGGALDNHLNHGDWLVSEEMCDAIADNDCDRVAGTQQENDASCDDNDPSTVDSCVATECANQPIVASCPCDFSAVPMTASAWGAVAEMIAIDNGPGVNGTLCGVDSDPFDGVAQIFVQQSATALGCGLEGPGLPLNFVSGLSSAEANACASDVENYATSLNAVSAITVTNVNTPCPTF